MKITYDETVDSAYIEILSSGEGSVSFSSNAVQPKGCPGEVNIDFDANGRLLGVEVIAASLVIPDALKDI